MSQINLNKTVGHTEARALIRELGNTNTFMLQSEPGVGKSSMLATLSKETGMPGVYIDAPVFDIPDIMMPMVDREQCITRFALNENLGLHLNRPQIFMVDELLKAAGPTKLMLTRFILERFLGAKQVHPGSIVFCTSNNASDGVGDSMAEHLRNRLSVLQLRKPTAKEWLKDYAFDNGVAPEICAWVDRFPHCMNSYRDYPSGKVDNPYIFDPKRKTGEAFVSPRSLDKASNIVKKRGVVGMHATMCALSGCIGPSAAADMSAFLQVADKLPAYGAVIASPGNAPLPDDNPAAMLVMIFGLAARVEDKNMSQVAQYVDRMQKEYQLLFYRSLSAHSRKSVWTNQNRIYRDWHVANKDYLISDIDG